MNTILHIVKKDLRIGGSSILIFLGLLFLNIVAQSPIMPEGAIVTQIARNLIPMVLFIVLFTCIVTVVLEDPVAGTNAFWLTRPPRGGTLLAAKALLIGAMVCAYLLGQVIILAMNGGFRLTPYLLGGFVVGTIPIIAVFFAIVSMATDPVRFFVKLAIVAAAFGVLAVVVGFLVDFLFPGGSIRTVGSPTVAASARVAVGGLALLGAGALVWHQYATRRTVRTGIIGGLAALGLVGLFLSWKVDLFKSMPSEERREKALGLDGFQPSVRPDSLSVTRTIYEDLSGEEHVSFILNTMIDTEGLGAEWSVQSIDVSAKLGTAEGQALESRISRSVSPRDTGEPPLEGFRMAGGGDPREFGEGIQVPLVDLPEADYRALGTTEFYGTLELSFIVARREIASELPLEDGAEARVDAEQWKLRRVQPRYTQMTTTRNGITESKQVLSGIEIDMDVCSPDLWLLTAREGRRTPQYFSEVPVVLINRERREWIRRGGGGSSFNAGQPGLPVARNSLNIQFSDQLNGDLAQDWLDGATLGIVEDRDRTTITRTLRIEGGRVIQD